MVNLKPVVQEHGTGCAVACVAFVLGIPYKRALKLFSKPENAASCGYMCRDLVAALARGGMAYKFNRIDTEDRKLLRRGGVIAYVERSARYPLGHFLARTEDGRWMNPWINFPVIASAEAGFQRRLPGTATYIVHPLPVSRA